MMVNGPLEIYSTVIGAKLYDDLFNILVSFGVAFIPLLVIFFTSITNFFETPFANASDTSLKRTGFHLFLYVFAMMLFVAPTHRLDVTGITYRPVCMSSAQVSRYGDTGTTYDNAFEDLQYSDIRIPWGLAFVLTGASGITNAAITSMPCKTDVQAIQTDIDTTRLTPELKQQVNRFQQECFATARSQFDQAHLDRSTYQDTMNNYGGQSDLSWVGSHVLQELYYRDLNPTSPVPGFPYAAYPYRYQSYNSKAVIDTPQWGFPSCYEWWNDSQHGLENQLVQLVNNHSPKNSHIGQESTETRIESWIADVKNFTQIGAQVSAGDVISHGLLYGHASEGGFGPSVTNWMDDGYVNDGVFSSENKSFTNAVGQGFAQVGQGVTEAFNSIKRAEIAQEIPILQAVLMAMCLALGPIILVMGGYRFSVIFSYYFIVSSIISITFLEALIHYIEESLHASMSYGIYALGNNAVMYNVFTELYFYVPVIYLAMMSICGVQAGRAVGGFFENSVSGSGGKLAKNVVTSALV